MSTKTIVLLRHGQYIKRDQNKKQNEELTKLGVRQARFAGQKMKEFQFDEIIHSTMPRAIQTAKIVKKEIKYRRKMHAEKLLCECVPRYNKKISKNISLKDPKKLKKNAETLDAAYKKYFKPSKKDQTVLLVCHGNVIRYLVCKHLGVDTRAWTKLDIQQCAFSVALISKKDQLNNVVLSHNETGHIPKKLRTFL
jgi:serine/threonine-protein phosphatase PGAM5